MPEKAVAGVGEESTVTRFAWVIEADGTYWDGKFADSRGFDADPYRAIRFIRREDAETVKHWLLQVHAFALKTVEHGWDEPEKAKPHA